MASEDANQNPHTGRSRSSTLSGSFGPITPNPRSSQQQHHERRASFLGSLLGFPGAGWPSSATPPGSTFGPSSASADGSIASASSTPWGSPSSLAESESTALSSVDANPTDDFPKMRAKAMSMSMSSSPFAEGAKTATADGGQATMGTSPFGSWGRAASWMAERGATVESPIEAPVRRPSMTYFRRPFEFASYSYREADTAPIAPPPTSAIDVSPAESGFAPLSRVTSAPSAPDHTDGLDHEAKRGRSFGWWGRDAGKPKRRLSPMGERMIRGDVVH